MTTWIKKLDPYKALLDLGTNEGLRYNDETKSRYQSVKKCMEILANTPNARILELGTCRSYVDGKFEGCNEDNPKYWEPNNPEKWDWGAGMFSILMHLCMPPDVQITSLDLMRSHVTRWERMVASFPTDRIIKVIVSDSVGYLTNLPRHHQQWDLIYLDTGDMWPIGPTCELQLAEAKAIVEHNLLAAGGILLIDDVLNGTPQEQGDANNKLGKSELAIPYLLDNGFEIIFEGYQYILRKK